MDKLDYKKAYKELYQPPTKPVFVDVPQMMFIAVEGKGDPNTSAEYKEAMELLYGLSYTIKMSKMSGAPEGYFEYVVPPLEGLWWVEDEAFDGTNITDKSRFCWISMIRQPEFVTEEVFAAAKEALKRKKPQLPVDKARLMRYDEGMCVQIMHKGSYDDEPQNILRMREFAEQNGCREDFETGRYHHEIYLSDPRKCAAEKLRTVIRHPAVKNI